MGVEPPATPTFTRVQPHPEIIDDESPVPDNIGDYHPPARPPDPRGEVVFEGRRVMDDSTHKERVEVTVSDAHGTRPLHPRLDLRRHSPMGLEWGYPGSGPAQLALALLADLFDDATAERLYQDFKRSVVAHLPYGEWELTATEVRELLAHPQREQPPFPPNGP